MSTRKSEAVWNGSLTSGKGMITLGSGTFTGEYSFKSRFEEGRGTNPEELIAAAHAGCFSMALAHNLEEKGHIPKQIQTTAEVRLEKTQQGFKISQITLTNRSQVPDVSEETFQEAAKAAKETCPVSQALQGCSITLKAVLA